MNAHPPRHVFLFSGHLIDAKERPDARFPHRMRDIAAAAIAAQLARLDAGVDDVGLCGGACGGDLLFAEAMLARGARVEVRIPFDERRFLDRSVTYPKGTPPADDWLDRYVSVTEHPRTSLFIMPPELESGSPVVDPYERCNVWQLDAALAFGEEKVHAVLLWDGQSGDGPGGTKHMHDAIKVRTGQVYVLNTRALWTV